MGIVNYTNEPVPAAMEVTIPEPIPGDCESFRPYVEEYDWDSDIMLSIIKHESGCMPSAVNNNPATGDYSVGLTQVNLYGKLRSVRPTEADLKDYKKNLAYAYKIYEGAGKRFGNDWTTCKKVKGCF